MEKTVVALFDNLDAAQTAVKELLDSGFGRDDISVVRTNHQDDLTSSNIEERSESDASGAAAGAGIGAVLGGLAGLLVGLGALAIPGIGPIIAAGPLATALAGAGLGAATGGLVGALADAGVPEGEAGHYAEGVRRGGTLVTVRADEEDVIRATEILNRFTPVDLNQRASEWQASDQTGDDEESAAQAGASQASASQGSGSTGITQAGKSGYRTTMGMTGENSGGTYEGTGSAGYTGSGTTYEGSGTFTSNTTNSESTAQPASAIGQDDAGFRSHWETNYRGGSGLEYGYERYQPAYQYGWQLGDEYRGRDWKDFEANARTEWEHSHPDDAWQDFRPAVHYGWQQHTGDAQRYPQDLSVASLQGARESALEGAQGASEQDPMGGQGYDRTMENMSRSFDTFERDFRSDWDNSFRSSGFGYERFQPAYQYGYNLATDVKYRSRKWSDIEPDARRDWESRHPNDAWEDFKDAVQHAWDHVRGSEAFD